MNFRRSAAMLAGAAVLLTGCGSGDELPTKAEFITDVKSEMGDQLDALKSAGLDADKADEVFDEFLGCIYDKVKDDEELLRQVADESGDAAVSSEIETRAADCADTLTEAITGG